MKHIHFLLLVSFFLSGCTKVFDQITPTADRNKRTIKPQEFRIKQLIGKGRSEGITVTDTVKFKYNKLGNPVSIVSTFRLPGSSYPKAVKFLYTNDHRLSWILPNYRLDTLTGLQYSNMGEAVDMYEPASIDPLTYKQFFFYQKTTHWDLVFSSDGTLLSRSPDDHGGGEGYGRDPKIMRGYIDTTGKRYAWLTMSGAWHDFNDELNHDEWGNEIFWPTDIFDRSIHSLYHTHLVWKIWADNFNRHSLSASSASPNRVLKTFGNDFVRYPATTQSGSYIFGGLPNFKYSIEYEPK